MEQQPERGRTSNPAAFNGMDVSTFRILVAEDNPVNQTIALRQLRQLGYTCEAVTNGRKAVDAIQEQHFDVVLMDCQMPELDGYAATAAIRALDGTRSQIVIIAMTGNSSDGDRQKCLTAGMDDYVSKPVKTDELQTVLQLWLSQRTVNSESENESGVTTPPVDMAYLQDVSGGDATAQKEMLETFLTQISGELQSLSQAVEQSDYDKLRTLAKSCAGACSSCGMTAMIEPLRKLADSEGEIDPNNAKKFMARIEKNFVIVKAFLAGQANGAKSNGLNGSKVIKSSVPVGSRKILIMETNPIVAKSLHDMFREAGYASKVAADGEAGLNLIKTIHPDVVLMELMLPGLSGVKVLQWLRTSEEFKRLPVIVFSNSYMNKMLPQEPDPATFVFTKDKVSPELVNGLVFV